MGVPAYADERHDTGNVESEAVSETTGSGLSGDNLSDQGAADQQGSDAVSADAGDSGQQAVPSDAEEDLSAAASDDSEATSETASVERLPLADTVSFVYVDASVVASGDVQYIAVGFADETLVAKDATLELRSSASAEGKILRSAAVTQGAVLFAFAPGEQDIASYVIDALRWHGEDESLFSVSFNEDSEKTNSYTFDVVTPQLAQTLKEASEISDSGDTSVLVIDDDGNLSACASVEEALDKSDPDAAAKGFAGESIVPEFADGFTFDEDVADESQQESNVAGGQAGNAQAGAEKPANPFQTVLDSIVAFFRSLFVPEDAYAAISSARENYLIVAIDPGHGGYDSGAVLKDSDGIVVLTESYVNLSIARHFSAELATYSGVTPYQTRYDDSYVGLQERVDRAVNMGADVFISVHCNATGTGNGYGAEVWVPNYASYLYQETHVAGYELGDKILAQLTALGLHNRDVKTRDCTNDSTYPDGSKADYYSVIYGSRAAGIPGIIVEHAFIDNASDAGTYLASESSRKQLGIADATGVANQYALMKDSAAQAQSSVKVTAHVSRIGWESSVYDGKVAGTTGKSFKMEAFQATLQNDAAGMGGIEYRSASVNEEWQGWVADGATSGTTGQAKPLEAIQMKLTGGAADAYDVYYRAHVSNVGWLGWAKNGESAGSSGYGFGIEAIEIALVEKGGAAPGPTETCFVEKGPTLSYSAHVQYIGWQKPVVSPKTAGTTGQSLRVEALKASLEGFPYDGGIEISTHVQDVGWMDYVPSGEAAGTEGQGLRLEALKAKLTGDMAEHYNVYYRVHAQNIGWMGWAKNGESAGTEGFGWRLEGVQIALVEKGGAAPGPTEASFIKKSPTLEYSAHVQYIGWQKPVVSPKTAGTTGQSLRVEALKASLEGFPYDGGIEISAHVQYVGWMDYVPSGGAAGTEGQGLRLEAMRARLIGDMAEHYDVYYRVHAQNIGWMGWAKNGESAGTEGFGWRLEGVQIALVEKGGAAPGPTETCFVEASAQYFIMGESQTTVAQMVRRYNNVGKTYPASVYAQYGAPTIQDFCQILYEEAAAEGVRAEVVFAQAMHETGWLQFGGDVSPEQCNFAGIGATGGGVPGNSFNDWGTDSVRKGLRAQIQHLKAYASTDPLVNECVDPRFHYVTRGCAPTLEDLGGRWAVGSSYGQRLEEQVDYLLAA